MLEGRIKAFYAENDVDSKMPMRRFSITKIKSGKNAPKLKAKAGQARRLLPFTLDLVTEFRREDGDVGEFRYQSVKHLSEVYAFSGKYELSDSELSQWRWASAVHMYYYVSCGYRVYPKHHYFMHLPEHVWRSGVPRSFWVYSDEAKNSQFKNLFEVVSEGSNVCIQILLRLEWRFALEHLLFEKAEM